MSVISDTFSGVPVSITGEEEGSLRVNSLLGHLEIYHNEEWGAICDDSWDPEDSYVACKQLGYRFANTSFTAEPFIGELQIWIDELGCTGTEERLTDCDRLPWGKHNCQLTENKGVICYDGKKEYVQSKALVQNLLAFAKGVLYYGGGTIISI